MSETTRRVVTDLLSACLLLATGAAVGMILPVALTVGLLAYAGRRTGRISLRDAIAAGALSLGLNLSVLVIAPVTVDRSVSVFILGHMAAHEGRTFTAGQIETALRDIYFGDLKQVDRRVH